MSLKIYYSKAFHSNFENTCYLKNVNTTHFVGNVISVEKKYGVGITRDTI